nr:class I SAM-dependent methyltransferase [Bdellovibrio sp. HAGR004]
MTSLSSKLKELIESLFVRTYGPLCQSKNKGLNPLPDFYRQNAEKFGYVHYGKGEMTALETYSCKQCGASDRERLYAYWLRAKQSQDGDCSRKALIHFAPEAGLSTFLKKTALYGRYETADLMMEDVSHRVDLMKLPFGENSYDFFICSHVLEHVDDDAAAIQELYRITKVGGGGILMAPIITDLPRTIEDPTVKDEEERWRRFGQNDHVRLYNRFGYLERIRAQGFRVELLGKDFFGRKLFNKLGLKASSVLYVVYK